MQSLAVYSYDRPTIDYVTSLKLPLLQFTNVCYCCLVRPSSVGHTHFASLFARIENSMLPVCDRNHRDGSSTRRRLVDTMLVNVLLLPFENPLNIGKMCVMETTPRADPWVLPKSYHR